jgi:predicted enzyme related to lactoylglutathione lyase
MTVTGTVTGAVTGIGGFFFRAKDPAALADWYRRHLDIQTGGDSVWMQQAGPTVFAPFPADTGYFASDRAWMLNLRVEGLDALLATLTAAGIEVERRAEWDMPGVGRFARIHDPEGNPIELWEPDE